MRILLTNLVLTHRTGTETVIRDLAIELAARSHHIEVFSPAPGELAAELSAAGIRVLDDPGLLSEPEIIHGQHHVPTMLALLRFPGVPAVYYCHDRTFFHDEPPRHPRILKYLAVDDHVLQRCGAVTGDAKHVQVILNSVPLHRFPPRPPLPERCSRRADL